MSSLSTIGLGPCQAPYFYSPIPHNKLISLSLICLCVYISAIVAVSPKNPDLIQILKSRETLEKNNYKNKFSELVLRFLVWLPTVIRCKDANDYFQ